MPAPKDPQKYLVYIQRQREARLGKDPWNKGFGVGLKETMKRFNSKYVILSNGCWEWRGYINSITGYGSFWYNNTNYLSHRFSYEIFNGSIPSKLTVDHICKNRKCVNPYHLDLTTRVENVLRSENKIAHNKALLYCPHGHIYDKNNTYVTKKGFRQCRSCNNIKSRIYKVKKRGNLS